MKSKHLIDHELIKALGDDPPTIKISSENLEQVHNFYVSTSKDFADPASAHVNVSRKTITGPDGTANLEVLVFNVDRTRVKPAVLYIHGGGYVMGTADMNEGYCKKLALDLDAVIVSVDYRLAPKTRFPGSVEDCYSALLWLKKEHVSLGIDTSRIAVTGESAGGGLAASLAFLVRDRKEVSLVLQFLTYPMLDDRTGSTVDPGAFQGEYIWTRESNMFGWQSLLGQKPGLKTVPYPAVPARIDLLTGLAPAFIVCGSLDLFAGESLAYAGRLIEQGVPTEIHIYSGAVHGFIGAVGTQMVSRFYEKRKAAFSKAFAQSESL